MLSVCHWHVPLDLCNHLLELFPVFRVEVVDVLRVILMNTVFEAPVLSVNFSVAVVLRVKQHIIQRMIVRFLSQSVDVGVIVGVAIGGSGDVSPFQPSVVTSLRRRTRALGVVTHRLLYGVFPTARTV